MPRKNRRSGRAGLLASLAAVVLAGGGVVLGQAGGSNVAATKHNLTASGPGPVKTTVRAEVCVFCHTPHAASPQAPLWNRQDPGTWYQTYDSSTLVADVDQPTGSSRLCLSCHDGTIALNQTYNAKNAPGGSVYLSAQDRGYIGTDLSDDHPISFRYDSGLAAEQGELRDPAALPDALPLDREQQLQCTTCHDPHDDSIGHFLRMTNQESQLCRSCHEISGWNASSHAVSSAALTAAVRDQWNNLEARTVRGAGCESCHRPHSAGGRHRLLRFEAEEDNCFSCHDGTVARTDLARAFAKPSVHPVSQTTGTHDPLENPLNMTPHVECADCHDPHGSTSAGPDSPPLVQPEMAGASGMSESGRVLEVATTEYEVCYKCHAQRNFARSVVTRELGNDNIADEFSASNASFHPVTTPGRNPKVPSLVQGLSPTSMVHCTDCHGSDDPTGAQGPHGSRYRPLLVAEYRTADPAAESPFSYALCYRCHNRSSILADESFPTHREHVIDERTACSVCHDPHGVAENTHLINFDRSVVGPSPSAGTGPTFNDFGNLHGSCTLSCHGEDHNDRKY